MLADLAPLVERLQRSEQGRKVLLPEGFAELWKLVWAAREELTGTGLAGAGIDIH